MLSEIRKILYPIIVNIIPWWLRTMYKMDIGKDVGINRKASLDRVVNPRGIHIGDETLITGGVVILAHDDCRNLKADVFIGKRCFIGICSIILPGVKIGDDVIIGAGSVVSKDIPSNCIAAGVPAKVIKQGIHTKKYGILLADSSMDK